MTTKPDTSAEIEMEADPSAMPEPWTVIMHGLAAQARGEEVDLDAMDEACTLVAAANLVQAGLSMDTVERLFTERPYHFKVAYDRDTDDLTVDVVWDDEEAEADRG